MEQILNDDKIISVKKWLIMIIISWIPIIGVIFLIKWGFIDKDNVTKQNWSQVMIIFVILGWLSIYFNYQGM